MSELASGGLRIKRLRDCYISALSYKLDIVLTNVKLHLQTIPLHIKYCSRTSKSPRGREFVHSYCGGFSGIYVYLIRYIYNSQNGLQNTQNSNVSLNTPSYRKFQRQREQSVSIQAR